VFSPLLACLRFLRARKWNLNDALEMAENWYIWWTTPTACGSGATPQSILDDITDRHEDIYTRLCPLSHTGVDRDGCPIYWEQSGPISQVFNELAESITLDEMLTRHIRNQELAMCRLSYLSKYYSKPIEKQVIVFNLSSLVYSLDTRSLSVFRQIISCDQNYYPERLKHFFVINAPWYFTAIWTLVKPWIDPITREKMQILGTDYLSVLLKYIDLDQIPMELGGQCEEFHWHWPYAEKSYATAQHIDQYNLARGRYSQSKLGSAQGEEGTKGEGGGEGAKEISEGETSEAEVTNGKSDAPEEIESNIA
jgi:hypothetical protein